MKSSCPGLTDDVVKMPEATGVFFYIHIYIISSAAKLVVIPVQPERPTWVPSDVLEGRCQ